MPARCYRELLAFLTRLVNDRDKAADLTQESYARILAVQQTGEQVEEPRAFLYRTARNLAVDQHRRALVRSRAETEPDAAAGEAEALAAPPAWQPDVAASAWRALGLVLLGDSLRLCVGHWGPAVGAVAWCGVLSLAAAGVVLALSYGPRQLPLLAAIAAGSGLIAQVA